MLLLCHMHTCANAFMQKNTRLNIHHFHEQMDLECSVTMHEIGQLTFSAYGFHN